MTVVDYIVSILYVSDRFEADCGENLWVTHQVLLGIYYVPAHIGGQRCRNRYYHQEVSVLPQNTWLTQEPLGSVLYIFVTGSKI